MQSKFLSNKLYRFILMVVIAVLVAANTVYIGRWLQWRVKFTSENQIWLNKWGNPIPPNETAVNNPIIYQALLMQQPRFPLFILILSTLFIYLLYSTTYNQVDGTNQSLSRKDKIKLITGVAIILFLAIIHYGVYIEQPSCFHCSLRWQFGMLYEAPM